MHYKWDDYGAKYEDELESWQSDHATRKFGIDSARETHESVLADGYIHNEEYFCKVVLENADIIAIVLILRGDGYHPTTISEITVNPQHRHKGHGTKIINELTANLNQIVGFDGDIFQVMIYPNNPASLRAFEKADFVLAGSHIDGDCSYWCYPADKLKDYQARNQDEMGSDFVAV